MAQQQHEGDNEPRTSTAVHQDDVVQYDDDLDGDNNDAMALVNYIRKIRALSSLTPPTTTTQVKQIMSQNTSMTEESSLPTVRVVVPETSPTSPTEDSVSILVTTTIPDEERIVGGDDGSIVVPTTSDRTTGIYTTETTATTTRTSLCVAQTITLDMIATERERIFQQVVENVTANAVIAQEIIVSIKDHNDEHQQQAIDVNEDQLLSRKFHENCRRHCRWQYMTLFTIVGISVLAMGALRVARRKNESISASPPTPSIERTFPSSAPTTQIQRNDAVFYTTEELYEAVDAYLMSLNDTSSPPETSNVARRYGYPMNTWNVSLLTNFTRVFDPSRYNVVPFDPYSEPPLYPNNMSHFNEDLSLWDVSNAETMFGMFAYAGEFQGIGIDHWDTSNVKDLSFTFFHCHSFTNTQLHKWNTSRVTLMDGTFGYAKSFSGDLSTWDVSSVTSMSLMFLYAEQFTGMNLQLWDVSNVKDMWGMFYNAVNFSGNVSVWNTSQVLYIHYMFADTLAFNADLSSWSVGKVEEMSYMLASPSFSGDWDLSNWDTSRVTSMVGIFMGAESFTGNVSSWDVSNVLYMDGAFDGCTKFNGDLSKWDTSQVETMDRMFMDASMFVSDLSNWNTNQVVTMKEMFMGAKSFNSDISTWDMSSVMDTTRMFSEAESFNQSLCQWQQSLPTNCEVTRMFEMSACAIDDDPILTNSMNGGFCTACN